MGCFCAEWEASFYLLTKDDAEFDMVVNSRDYWGCVAKKSKHELAAQNKMIYEAECFAKPCHLDLLLDEDVNIAYLCCCCVPIYRESGVHDFCGSKLKLSYH